MLWMKLKGVPYMFFYHYHLWYLTHQNLQYLYCFGIVTSGKSESDSSGKSGNSYSELVESKIHSLIGILFVFCRREMVFGAIK